MVASPVLCVSSNNEVVGIPDRGSRLGSILAQTLCPKNMSSRINSYFSRVRILIWALETVLFDESVFIFFLAGRIRIQFSLLNPDLKPYTVFLKDRVWNNFLRSDPDPFSGLGTGTGSGQLRPGSGQL